jgi:hypothetical protein
VKKFNFTNLRNKLSIKWETDTWNAEIYAIVTKVMMCNLLLEGYENCNHEKKIYLYCFKGNVTMAMTWELAFQ